jgi:ABC-type multidrug transport system ATPase subunit
VTLAVLELRGVRAAYGRIEVLHGVDLIVPPRSVVALLGPNGAGKTTTLRVASGQHWPTDGCVHVMGKHVTAPILMRWRAPECARSQRDGGSSRTCPWRRTSR